MLSSEVRHLWMAASKADVGEADQVETRWERLFAGLEARFDELAEANEIAERADRERVAVGSVTAAQRLAGAIGAPVRIRLAGGAMIGGHLRAMGADWLLVAEAAGRECLVCWRSVIAVEGITAATGPELTGVQRRLDLRRALRGLARDRAPLVLALAGWRAGMAAGTFAASSAQDPVAEVIGTIDRVGADFVEVAVHAAWEPRRSGTVRAVALVPLDAVVLVRSAPLG
jgi:hypothetical protein